jgi:hypothetical protein
MLKNRQENVINNNFWNNALKSYYIDGLDIVSSYAISLKNISTKSIEISSKISLNRVNS